MIVYNLYLVLNNERIKIYDNITKSVVYEGISDNIPDELMNELVRDMTIVYEKAINRTYFLIVIN